MNPGAIRSFIESELPRLVDGAQSGEAGYALPPSSLTLLGQCVERLGVQRAFEFGSGQSSLTLIEAGIRVTAVEDSEQWLQETLALLPDAARERFTGHRLPIGRAWVAGAPMRSWPQLPRLAGALAEADLVLIDSPALPPFREHPLAMALEHARNALIIVDDARITTVARFCRRLAEQNGAPFHFASVDHGLFFCGPASRRPLDCSRPWLETLKAWRRYWHPRAGGGE